MFLRAIIDRSYQVGISTYFMVRLAFPTCLAVGEWDVHIAWYMLHHTDLSVSADYRKSSFWFLLVYHGLSQSNVYFYTTYKLMLKDGVIEYYRFKLLCNILVLQTQISP